MDEIIREDALTEADKIVDTINFYLHEHANTKEETDEIRDIFIKAFTKVFTQCAEEYKVYLEELEDV